MKLKLILRNLLFVTLILLVTQPAHAISGRTKATVRVVNEEGEPIEGCRVGISFQYDKAWATGVTAENGVSDEKGEFFVTGTGNGYIGYGADKEGYYSGSYRYEFKEKGLFGWKPWNPELEVVLRKIENPVPMYARSTKQSEVEIPVIDKEVGFDLIAFDWVAPYGVGSKADFIFLLHKDRKGPKDFSYDLTLSFANSFDGIQSVQWDVRNGSDFILPRYAPLEGYGEKVTAYIRRGPDIVSGFSWRDFNHYIFRVRSEEENGELIRAMYGKILGDIRIRTKHPGTAYVEFQYYLNPDYTRNLEFDPDQNLFKNLPEREKVGIK